MVSTLDSKVDLSVTHQTASIVWEKSLPEKLYSFRVRNFVVLFHLINCFICWDNMH